RPLAVVMNTAAAATTATATTAIRAAPGHWPSNQQNANTPAATSSSASAYLTMTAAEANPGSSTLLFTRLATLDGTPGGTRTPNLRFWRPLLCQLSYWRTEIRPAPGKGNGGLRRLAPIRAGRRAVACRGTRFRSPPWRGPCLLDDLRHHARADGPAALADREAQALVHRDRVDQRHRHLHVVARHHHLRALRQRHRAGDVRGAEVELRAVTLEERRVAAALVLRQHVHLRLELGVRGDR